MRERSRIWFAFLGGALAWTLHLMGTYFLSEGFCRSGLEQISLLGWSLMLWVLALLTFLTLAVTGAAFWMARRLQLQGAKARGSGADIGAKEQRSRPINAVSLAMRPSRDGLAHGNVPGDVTLFMARSSLLSNGLFFFVIVAQSFPIVILGRSC